ncbi:MAG: site-2 protease family protein [Anaerolineae bacterium]|nr:site-2 protease family protein [Anaerolineae bacterium]
MGSGFRIGRIFGINVRVDWSWLFIFFLVTWNLASVFGQVQPDWQPLFRWIVAGVAALLFFGSVLAHEMAHSLVARAQGLPVRNITLFLFGGVSNIQREPDSPREEFVMALVGPLTSIVLGAVLVLIANLTADPAASLTRDPLGLLGQLSPVTLLLFWLGSVNILVGLFNLIPGFPLDGGRVLRSIFWAATDNLRRATRWAAGVGQGVAWLLILTGLAMVFGVQVPIFGTGLIGGLWLAFIGWFLNSAAIQSYQQVVIRDILEGIPVSRMMRPNPPTVTEGITVSSLVYDYVMAADDRAFPVFDDGRMTGIVTVEDLRKVDRSRWDETLVRQIMTPAAQLVTIGPDEEASEALNRLAQRDIRQLPVVQEGQLVGLLRRRDLIRWLQLHSELAREAPGGPRIPA